jgi:hypothetical protein
MKILIVDYNLFEENSHVVSNCDVEQCKIIWKPNYAKGAKSKPLMQLLKPLRVECLNDEKRFIKNMKHPKIFGLLQYRLMLKDRGLWC